MVARPHQPDSSAGVEPSSQPRGAGEPFLRFLRFSHIFASAVREALEEEILREVSPTPLSGSQFRLLKLMALRGQHRIREIAGLLGVSPPAATKNIDKLERLGLVFRMPSRGDRRATLLLISPEAQQLVRDCERIEAARVASLLAGSRPAEIEQLCSLLERFSMSLLAKGGSDSGCCLRCAANFDPDCLIGQARGVCPYESLRGASAARGGGETK